MIFTKQNVISYKGKRFNSYTPDKNGVCLGYKRDEPKQYQVKIYDKDRQNQLSHNLMRFELRFVRMQ